MNDSSGKPRSDHVVAQQGHRTESISREVKPICFYLPQFHPIPENDRWWGKGFTEWSLVNAAKPLFNGHRQPVAPHPDLGRYNLLDTETRRRQGEIARAYGIHGFCYYHYWFNGKRLLEAPLERMLEDGEPDLPFCLCWANEPWTRTWSGADGKVLQAQDYGGVEDWRAHFRSLLPYLVHRNALSVAGRPMLLIYRPGHVIDLEGMVDCWRREADAAGLSGLHLLGVLGNFADNRVAPGCLDGAVEHHPGCFAGRIEPLMLKGIKVFPMESAWSLGLSMERRHDVQYPGACLHWDNSPRAGYRAGIFTESREERAEAWLSRVAARARDDVNLPEPFVFVNSWNEWSEGAYVEPDTATGYARLEILQRGLHGATRQFDPVVVEPPGPNAGGDADYRAVDTALLNILIGNGIHAARAWELNAGTGYTGIFARAWLGADFYGAALFGDEIAPLTSLSAVCQADDVASLSADLVILRDGCAPAARTDKVLDLISGILVPGGRLLIGFENSQHHERLGRESDEGATLSLREARLGLQAAGFQLRQSFRVFEPAPPPATQLQARDNRLEIDGRRFQGLSPAQVNNLYTRRFFLLAEKPAEGSSGATD